MRLTIVGEAPGFTGEGKPALGGPTGDRLARAAGLRDAEALRARVRLVNVLDYFPGREKRGGKGAAFPLSEARPLAEAMLREADGPLVLLGRRVGAAFGVGRIRFLRWNDSLRVPVAIVPHPSGIVRWWNDDANRERVREFFADLIDDDATPKRGDAA